MEPNIIDMLATNTKSSEVADAIKASLYAKSIEKLDQIRPLVANEFLGLDTPEEGVYDDTTETQEEEN